MYKMYFSTFWAKQFPGRDTENLLSTNLEILGKGPKKVLKKHFVRRFVPKIYDRPTLNLHQIFGARFQSIES